MKTNLNWHAAPLRVLVCLLTAFLGRDRSHAATLGLGDFGHSTMRVDGGDHFVLASGTRPLVVVLVDFATAPKFAYTSTYYDSLFFGPAHLAMGIQGYFHDNSRGRFNWVRAGAGVVGPVKLEKSDRAYTTPEFAGFPYDSNMVYKVMKSGVFDFRSYDKNGDKRITPDELTIVFISNDQWTDPQNPLLPWSYIGANRPWIIRDPVLDYSICWEVFTSHQSGLSVTAHELCHALGAKDLYSKLPLDGDCSQNLTVMSYSPGSADDTSSVNLDAWHKMQLGWCEPRIRSLPAGGIEQVPAAQIFAQPDEPLLLYDPARGPSDYFLLEYRTPFLPDSPYDTGLAYTTNGLVIWHVGPLPGSGVPVAAEGPTNLARGSSHPWPSGAVTPRLKWLDGSSSPATVSVRPFSTNDDTITVEWISEGDTWVAFGPPRVPEVGTFEFPFSRLSSGLAAVPHGGTLKFKPGGSAETATITKRVRLEAFGGPVTIGR